MPFFVQRKKTLNLKHKTIIKLFSISREEEKEIPFSDASFVFIELRAVCAWTRLMQNCYNMDLIMNLPT